MKRRSTILAGLLAAGAWAATLPYQGLATDSKGNPRADGTAPAVFSLYGSSSGGTAAWSESQSVATRKGLFSASLGGVTAIPDSLLDGRALWLGVALDGGAEASPRLAIQAPSYAARAGQARKAVVADSAGKVAGFQDSVAALRASLHVQSNALEAKDSVRACRKADSSTFAARSDSGRASWKSDTAKVALHVVGVDPAQIKDDSVSAKIARDSVKILADTLAKTRDSVSRLSARCDSLQIQNATQQALLGAFATSVSVVAGGAHSLILKNDGALWATGSNTYGQLGDGTRTGKSTPVRVASGVKAMVAGGAHSLILKTDGTLWATGSNTYGQLGDGTATGKSTPVQVASGVKAMAAGGSHSLILKTDGTLWATGSNIYGQLGDGSTTDKSTPVQVASGVKAMAAGGSHSLILKTDGTLWATGSNTYGQLGDGTMTGKSTPVQVVTGVKAVAAGMDHSLILKTDGTLWAMGSNNAGQLGTATTTDKSSPVQVAGGVRAVAAGQAHSLVLKTDGALWVTGYNYGGQLGDGTTVGKSSLFQVANSVKAMSGGMNHTLLLKTDGTVWAMGYNASGELGDGTTTNKSTPVWIDL